MQPSAPLCDVCECERSSGRLRPPVSILVRPDALEAFAVALNVARVPLQLSAQHGERKDVFRPLAPRRGAVAVGTLSGDERQADRRSHVFLHVYDTEVARVESSFIKSIAGTSGGGGLGRGVQAVEWSASARLRPLFLPSLHACDSGSAWVEFHGGCQVVGVKRHILALFAELLVHPIRRVVKPLPLEDCVRLDSTNQLASCYASCTNSGQTWPFVARNLARVGAAHMARSVASCWGGSHFGSRIGLLR